MNSVPSRREPPWTQSRGAIANKNFDGLIGRWGFDENGNTTLETMFGFKVVKANNPIGCRFEFVEILEE